jgi:hypothetical protein
VDGDRRWSASVSGVVALLAIATAAVLTAQCGSKSTSTNPPAAPSVPGTAPAPAPALYTLTGTVHDGPSGGPVPGATVTVTSGPNANASATADATGDYTITRLDGGTFTLHTAARGYIAADENVTVSGDARHDVTLQREAATAPVAQAQCDATLWIHLYDPRRLKVIADCRTITGIVMTQHHSDDGDVDMRVKPDPPSVELLNAANNGTMQVEAICQGRIKPDTPQAVVSCAGFTGSVMIPPLGAHVQVTGSYVLDTNHKWMEIHPVTSITMTQ